jgi:hypothetical protein
MCCRGNEQNCRKLPKFEGHIPDVEKASKAQNDPEPKLEQQTERERESKQQGMAPGMEVSIFPTLKGYFAREASGLHTVYERLYPGSVPLRERKSLLFTELYNIKRLLLITSSEDYLPADSPAYPLLCRVLQDSELPPYYKPRDSEDRTLVFESRFESGNLSLAVQVAVTLSFF